MSLNVNVSMAKMKDQTFFELYKAEKDKEQKRISIMEEALDYVNTKAIEDFGFIQSAFSMEVCKLILIAKECQEKKD